MLFRRIYQRLAFNNFISGNYTKAERYFQRLLDAAPDRVGMRHNMGLVKLALGKFDEAVALFSDEIDRFGEEYHRLRALADACYLWGRPEEAAGWYKAARLESPGQSDTAFLEARLKICADSKAFEQALEGAKRFEEGTQALKLKDTERALELLEQAVGLDPTNYMARNNLGSIYLNEKKEYSKAAAEFEAALKYTDLPLIIKNLQVCETEKEKRTNEDA